MSVKIFLPIEGEIVLGKDSPRDWIPIDISQRSKVPTTPEVLGAKRYLRSKGIEVEKYPFDIGENIAVAVRRKDVTKTLKLLKHKKLRELV